MATFKNTLNPLIWDKNNNNLKPEVKAKLNQIAKAFIETLEIPTNAVEDIVITGSMASYNYTPHSDIDLHLVIDFEKVHTDCPIVGDYLLSKKAEFNQKHDIFIYGIPVEVYAEGVGQGTVHNGLYSLKTGWIDLPRKIKPTNNDSAVSAKYKEYKEAADNIKDGDLAEKLLDKIKKMRKAGLAEGGEFSVENLVFKKLRDTGVIERLMKAKKEGIDKKLSLGEEFIESLSESVSEGCYNDIITIVSSIVEDYRSFEEEKFNDGSSQAYKDLATVRNSIRRNKTKGVKQATKEANKAIKDQLKYRASKSVSYGVLIDKLNKADKALSNLHKAREDEKDAIEDTDKARKFAEKAKEFEEKYES